MPFLYLTHILYHNLMILSNRSFHWESCGVPPGLSLRVFITRLIFVVLLQLFKRSSFLLARRHDPIELREWALPLTRNRFLARPFRIPIIVFSCCVCLMTASSENLFDNTLTTFLYTQEVPGFRPQ